MANRSDRLSKTPRQIKRQLALAEAAGYITDAHQRGDVKRLMQAAHAGYEAWHKKMLSSKDNVESETTDARSENTATTPAP